MRTILTLTLLCTGMATAAEPDWVAPMKSVHAKFQGTPGYVAQLGDSITYSKAFWWPIGWDEADKYLAGDDGLPMRPEKLRWRDTLKGMGDKGPEFGNYSGWRVGNLLQVIDDVLAKQKPEVAIIMIGTNDVSGGKVPDAYGPGLKQVAQKCLDAGCVPILNTIPPRRDRKEAVEAANAIVRETAGELKVPLVDYYAECMRRRPGDSWQGTLISGDGVHPTGGNTNVYTEANLKESGYALRNWLNFLVVRELYFRVLVPDDRGANPEYPQ